MFKPISCFLNKYSKVLLSFVSLTIELMHLQKKYKSQSEELQSFSTTYIYIDTLIHTSEIQSQIAHVEDDVDICPLEDDTTLVFIYTSVV